MIRVHVQDIDVSSLSLPDHHKDRFVSSEVDANVAKDEVYVHHGEASVPAPVSSGDDAERCSSSFLFQFPHGCNATSHYPRAAELASTQQVDERRVKARFYFECQDWLAIQPMKMMIGGQRRVSSQTKEVARKRDHSILKHLSATYLCLHVSLCTYTCTSTSPSPHV